MVQFGLLTSFTSNVCRPLVLKSRLLSTRMETNSKRSTPETLVPLIVLFYESWSMCSSSSWAMMPLLKSVFMSSIKHA